MKLAFRNSSSILPALVMKGVGGGGGGNIVMVFALSLLTSGALIAG